MISRRFVLSAALPFILLISQFAPLGNSNLALASSDFSDANSAIPIAAFDFAKEICAARWMSGAGRLPCPSTDGDVRGFALSVDAPKLENGITDSAPELLVTIGIVPVFDDILASTILTTVYYCFCYHIPRLSHFT